MNQNSKFPQCLPQGAFAQTSQNLTAGDCVHSQRRRHHSEGGFLIVTRFSDSAGKKVNTTFKDKFDGAMGTAQ